MKFELEIIIQIFILMNIVNRLDFKSKNINPIREEIGFFLTLCLAAERLYIINDLCFEGVLYIPTIDHSWMYADYWMYALSICSFLLLIIRILFNMYIYYPENFIKKSDAHKVLLLINILCIITVEIMCLFVQ